MGPFMVILSSIIHGYEGTGRSLSLKVAKTLGVYGKDIK
jgi:tRNA(Met) C34 N-acetyltransferase TmcA